MNRNDLPTIHSVGDRIKKSAYDAISYFFGHPTKLNHVINKFSDSTIIIDESVSIGRRTKIIGDVEIRPKAYLSTDVVISGNVLIGNHTGINGHNSIIGDVNIGKYNAIAARARMLTRDHPTYKPGMHGAFYSEIGVDLSGVSNGPIDIGNDVWICSDAKILSDVTIGNGAVVGANAVVVDDVEPYSIVAGNPATHKKYRFNKPTREKLQEIAWWDWSEEKLKRNTDFFDADLREVDDVSLLIE